MKTPIATFIAKEFKHILRDRRTMLILVIMPVLLIFLLGFALSTDIRNVNVVFMSDTNDDVVQRIVNRIDMSEYFTVVGRVYTTDEILHKMRSMETDVAVRFYRGQGLQIVVDASNPNIAASEALYLQNIIYSQLAEEADMPQSRVASKIRMLYNPRMQSSFNFIPGVLGLILILICAMMTSASIVREKETGTMEVLLTSPVRPITMIMAKMAPYFLLSCVNIASILLLARFVLGVPLAGSLLLIILFAVIYTIMSLSLGLLVSTITSSQTTALIISAIGLMVPVMMLSGMMFTIESMPMFFRVVSHAVPARWFIDAMRKLMIEGLTFQYVLTDFIVLSSMTLLFLAVAVKKFNSRLE